MAPVAETVERFPQSPLEWTKQKSLMLKKLAVIVGLIKKGKRDPPVFESSNGVRVGRDIYDQNRSVTIKT